MKQRRIQRSLAAILSFLLVFADQSVVSLAATAAVSSGDAMISEQQGLEESDTSKTEPAEVTENPEDEELGGGAEKDPEKDPEEDAEKDPEEEYPEEGSVSGGDARAPQKFYEDPEPEDYGTLVAYDEYSRTYRTGENAYVTVVGNSETLYINEDGELDEVDNTLVEIPALQRRFAVQGLMGLKAKTAVTSGPKYQNTANDYTVTLNGELTASGQSLYTITHGEHTLSATRFPIRL